MEAVVPNERTRTLRKALPWRRSRIKRGLILAVLTVLLAFHIAPVVTSENADQDLARRCAYLAKLIGEQRHPLDLDGDGSTCPYLRTHALPLVAEDAKARHAALCPYIQELSRQKRERADDSNFGKVLLAFLFPSNARVNSLLATLYISSVPNFILFFVPPDIQPSSLNTLVAFAVGGLLGDVFLHLLPQSFMGEAFDDQVHFVELDEKRNVVIGIGIFVGFATFFVIDKLMRVVNGGGDGSQSHGHAHAHSQDADVDDVKDSSIDNNGKSTAIAKHVTSSRQRTSPYPADENDKGNKSIAVKDKSPSVSIRLSAYLNLIADATHNFTDGLAMAASFYASPTVGATTAIAVFFHEIPHEIGDYAILIQSGFTKRYALLSQFITALGAFAGTLAGIAIEELGRGDQHVTAASADGGLLGSGVRAGDLVIPFTAGGFLYIATVGVIPELLEVSGRLSKDLRQASTEFAAMIVGVAAMAFIS